MAAEPPRLPPVIAIITDFGARDTFVGTMKGVILSRCPDAQLVDLTHEIPPGDLRGGAFQLRLAVPFFPNDAIFLGVVDPGVGSKRRAILLVAPHGQRFIGPDNGLLWPAASIDGPPFAHEITSSQYRLPDVSVTFHGRDVFAPCAAALANGVQPCELGPTILDPVCLELPMPRSDGDRTEGEVLWVDRFGNLITNIEAMPPPRTASSDRVFRIAGHRISGLAASYSDVSPGELCVVVSSGGTYEISVRDGNAAGVLGVGVGARVEILLAAPRVRSNS